MANPLDNPIWHSLAAGHAAFSIGGPHARRYAPAVAPFAAVGDDSPAAAMELEALVESGETVVLLGVRPPLEGWVLERTEAIVQFLFAGAVPRSPDVTCSLLGVEDRPQMLALTELVYPHYFRAETAALGDYFGVWQEGQLVAMAGTRMGFPGYREISAVCTHPSVRGKGLARALIEKLLIHITDQGDQPFLHTEAVNPAKGMYERLGFVARTELQVWAFKR